MTNDKPSQISPITLGTLYEQIVASSKERDPKKFWVNIFNNLRWIIPYSRMVFVCQENSKYIIKNLYEKGSVCSGGESFIGTELNEALFLLLGAKTMKWVGNPREKYKSVIDIDLMAWLLSDLNTQHVLIVPINKGDDYWGFLAFSLLDLPDSDKILISTLMSIYISYAAMNYELISALAIKKEREEQLLKSESVRTKLANLNAELKRKIEVFNKFVPAAFLKVLGVDKETDHVELGYSKATNIAVLFSDIRSFTMLSDQMTSDRVFQFINEYISHIGPAIEKNGGFIDKYIGDAIMAVFTSAKDSICAAIDMHKKLAQYNDERRRNDKQAIKIGIGINAGDASMGTIGFANRLETTVIGEVVNLASRLEHLTKEYGVSIIVSDSAESEVHQDSSFILRYLDYTHIRGIEERQHIYEVLNHLPKSEQAAKVKVSPMYQQAVGLFNKNDCVNAEALFDKCHAICPKDIAIQRYLKALRDA